jgi:hypothetical protein
VRLLHEFYFRQQPSARVNGEGIQKTEH